MRTRRGFTLIEMLVAITAATVVLATVVALLHTLFRADRANRDAAHRSAAVQRLSQQFRDDVHAAMRSTAMSKGEWRFDRPDGRTAVYCATADGILRTEKTADAAAQRQLFPLPPDVAVRIETATHGGPTLVSLVIAAVSDAAQPPVIAPLRIDAVLASDHRFARETSLQEYRP